ncbi:hypothetical protein M2139_002675, partial [Enterococcus sp. PF1-24]|nr:hypothetical protein [Enterococcus sp. PF1-24]
VEVVKKWQKEFSKSDLKLEKIQIIKKNGPKSN